MTAPSVHKLKLRRVSLYYVPYEPALSGQAWGSDVVTVAMAQLEHNHKLVGAVSIHNVV